MQGLWERRRPLRVAGHDVALLAPEDELLYLCFHSVVKGFVRLYRFLDLKLLIQAERLDWATVVERATRFGIARAVWINARVLNRHLDGGVPDWVVTALRPGASLARVLDDYITPERLLHDPNPSHRSIHSSRMGQWRKVVFARAALVRPQNVLPLVGCAFTSGAHRVYLRLTGSARRGTSSPSAVVPDGR